MSQYQREPSESAEIRPDAMTQPLGDTSDMTEFLFSQLPPHPPGEPVVPLRYVPVASRAWSFVNRYYPPNRLEPPDASPYRCDRCRPAAVPAALRRVEPTPMSQQSHEPPVRSAPTEEPADRGAPGTTPYYCDRCKFRATPAEALRRAVLTRIGPEISFPHIPVAPRAWPFLVRYIKGAPRPKRWLWCGIPQE